MYNKPVKCLIPSCPNMSQYLYCLTCSAENARRRSLQAAEGSCAHGHSVTGDYGMIMRLLPEYKGGHPHLGYMLDVCKACLTELPERPCHPTAYRRTK